MTETEWLGCTDARRMLDYQYRQAIAEKPALLVNLRFWRNPGPCGTISERKLRLFACACCRCSWHDLDDDARRFIELAESAADDPRSREQLRRITCRSPLAAWLKAEPIREQPSWLFLNWLAAGNLERRDQQMLLLRHIVGNPFRPYPASGHWSSAVIQLADALYQGEDCGFALHDALLESEQADLADHFRQHQYHPRGCWAVDLLLGKE